MSRLGMPTTAERYAGLLAAAYNRVAGGAINTATTEIHQQTAMLVRSLEDIPIPAPIVSLMLSQQKQGVAISSADVQARIRVLQQLAQEAHTYIGKEIKRLTEALQRFEHMMQATQKQASKVEYQDPALNAALGQFENDVRARCSSLADRLADTRYDSETYKHLLVDELLDMVNLARVMSGAAEVGYKQQRERWRTIGTELGIQLATEPPRGTFDIDALVQRFLLCVQLTYERPGVLKSIAQAFNRGKHHEKLTAEVNAGLEQIRPLVMETIAQAWHDAEQRWCVIAQAAAQTWLHTETGADPAGVVSNIQILVQKQANIMSWQDNLQHISPEQIMAGWRNQLMVQAVGHIADSLQSGTANKSAS